MKELNFYFGVIGVSLVLLKGSLASKAEERLLNDLFANYSADARPVINDNDAINMTFGLTLSQLVDVDEKNQILTLSVWMRQKWDNPVLAWDPEKYNGIKSINVAANKVWKPDIVLYNNANDDVSFGGNFDRLNTRIIMSYSGKHTWLAPVIIKSKCAINIKNFPFDEQRCTLKFGSWTYDGFRLNLMNESATADLGMFLPNAEWLLVAVPAVRNEIKYFCCPEPYPDVTFTVVIKRRTLFYLTNLILPMVIISVLTMLAFLLPAESDILQTFTDQCTGKTSTTKTGERMSLAITLLLAMTVFMILVADMIPPTSEVVPIVGVFFNAAMVEMVIMLIVLCLVSKLYNKEPTDPPMPMWMRKYFLEKLSYIIGVRRRPRPSSPSSQIATTEMRYLAGDANQNQQDTKSLLRSSASNMLQTPGNGFVAKNVLPNSGMYSTVDGTLSKSEEFQALSKKMDKVVEKIDDDEKDAKIKEEWRIVAMTIDKIFLCFFTLLIIITAIFCFLQAPEYVP